MNASACFFPASTYKGYRFPTEIISRCVWLYRRFVVSYRDVEGMMAERGVVVGLVQRVERQAEA